MARSFHTALPGLLCFLHQAHGAARHSVQHGSTLNLEAGPVTSIKPASISAGVPTPILLYGETSANDFAGFFADCKNVTPTTQVKAGINEYTEFTVEKVAKNLRLCYRKAGTTEVTEIPHVGLTTVEPTRKEMVQDFNPKEVQRSRDIRIKITTGETDLAGSHAIFIPVSQSCSAAVPSTKLDFNGVGKFSIMDRPGTYKLCYQDRDGSDSVEQIGPEVLTVTASDVTPPDLIESIFPISTSVNVLTTIYLHGAAPGDTAFFVNSLTGSCNSSTAAKKDVTIGHNQFLIPSSGTYTLCYQMFDTFEAVAQTNVFLTVKYGVTPDMLDRWPTHYRKEGTVVCSSLKQIPYCSSASINTCDKSFAIMTGVGLRCKWYTVTQDGPPFCGDADINDKSNICVKDSCKGTPEQCW